MTTTLKPVAQCKWVLKPFIVIKKQTTKKSKKQQQQQQALVTYKDIYTSQHIFNNPNAVNFMRDNWTAIIAAQEKTTSDDRIRQWRNFYLNPGFVELIEEKWEWLSTYCARQVSYMCGNKTKRAMQFIDDHWAWFIHSKYECMDWQLFFANPYAVPLIDKHWKWLRNQGLTSKCYDALYCNPAAVFLLEKHDIIINHPTVIDIHIIRTWILSNPGAINIITPWMQSIKSFTQEQINALLTNPAAVELIKTNWQCLVKTKKLTWSALCKNESAAAIALIDKNWAYLKRTSDDEMPWYELCCNPFAVDLIDRRWDEMFAYYATINEPENPAVIYYELDELILELLCNPNAIDLIVRHWDYLIENHYLKWFSLLQNPNAMGLIEQHIAEIIGIEQHITEIIGNNSCIYILQHPDIFMDEYREEATKYMRVHVFAELMAVVWHPKNIKRFCDWGVDPDA